MVVEHAQVEDAQAILDLQKLAYQSEAALYGDTTIPPLTQTIESMRADFERHTILKVTEAGRIIGSVRGRLEGDTCHIGRLIVHPDYQGRGIGTRLMGEIERQFASAARYELFTGDRSERNLYLYQKLGYSIFREEQLIPNVRLVYLEKVPVP
jgi:ribosomal protein S18 acetylase RimI-like enzyme